MTSLFLRQRQVDSVFELLGSSENDITYSLGWALARSPDLLRRLIGRGLPGSPSLIEASIHLQEPHEQGGFTDIEIIAAGLNIILEAKRGWTLPTSAQLGLYATRLQRSTAVHRALVVCSDCSSEYSSLLLTDEAGGFKVSHLGWRDKIGEVTRATGTHAELRLLRELRTYLLRVTMTQNQASNSVFVVSLGGDRPDWSSLSWREVVALRGKYFHRGTAEYPE